MFTAFWSFPSYLNHHLKIKVLSLQALLFIFLNIPISHSHLLRDIPSALFSVHHKAHSSLDFQCFPHQLMPFLFWSATTRLPTHSLTLTFAAILIRHLGFGWYFMYEFSFLERWPYAVNAQALEKQRFSGVWRRESFRENVNVNGIYIALFSRKISNFTSQMWQQQHSFKINSFCVAWHRIIPTLVNFFDGRSSRIKLFCLLQQLQVRRGSVYSEKSHLWPHILHR